MQLTFPTVSASAIYLTFKQFPSQMIDMWQS